MINRERSPDWYYREHLIEGVAHTVDKHFNALVFEIAQLTNNGTDTGYLNHLHALMYEAVYLGNPAARRRVKEDGSYE